MSVKSLLSVKQYSFLYFEYHEFLQNARNKRKKYYLHDFFEILRQKDNSFIQFSDKELSNKITASRRLEGQDEWPNLKDIGTYVNPQVRSFIEKAHSAALLGVEIYNKPIISYRSEGYIVMMMIAWNALFHAIFLQKGELIKYSGEESQNNYIDLRKCIKKYEGPLKKEIEANLSLLIEIRDKIVHRESPKIDERLFGHCQACLLNFERLLYDNFGEKYQLPNLLAYSLQFSKKYNTQQNESIKQYKNLHAYKVLEFIDEFENNLFLSDPDIYKSQDYCFRVVLIPRLIKEKNAEAAIEYIDYDSLETDGKEKIDKALLIIKESRVGGEFFKAGDVCKIVYEKLHDSKGPNWKFSPSYHHVKCAKYFNIREGYKTDNPENTKSEYCFYDATFQQYIYTRQWINLLINKLKDENIYSAIFS